MSDRFTVEPRASGGYLVRDNDQPKDTPFKDGVIYVTHSKKVADEHAAHLNRKPRG